MLCIAQGFCHSLTVHLRTPKMPILNIFSCEPSLINCHKLCQEVKYGFNDAVISRSNRLSSLFASKSMWVPKEVAKYPRPMEGDISQQSCIFSPTTGHSPTWVFDQIDSEWLANWPIQELICVWFLSPNRSNLLKLILFSHSQRTWGPPVSWNNHFRLMHNNRSKLDLSHPWFHQLNHQLYNCLWTVQFPKRCWRMSYIIISP